MGQIRHNCFMAIKLILMDIDNTLLEFDAFVRQFLDETFSRFEGFEKKGDLYEIFHANNQKLWQKLEQGEITMEQLQAVRWGMILEKLGIDFDGMEMERMFKAAMHESTIITPGAMEMLHALSEDYVLATASNGPYEQQVYRINKAGMGQYFRYHFISQDIGYSKPDPRFFEKARSLMKETYENDEILIVGDSASSDMQGGINAGIHTCYYDRENRGNTGGYDLCVNDLRQIAEKLEELKHAGNQTEQA